MYFNWILKSRNPRNSNLVRKICKNNYFSARTKLEVIRYTLKQIWKHVNLGGKFTSIFTKLIVCKLTHFIFRLQE